MLGDNVRDENFNYAVFDNIGSSPPSMQAAKSLDAVSLLPGFTGEQADGFSASTQCYLEKSVGPIPNTWVSLPEARWPEAWKGKYRQPVVPLILALYGHPSAGDC